MLTCFCLMKGCVKFFRHEIHGCKFLASVGFILQSDLFYFLTIFLTKEKEEKGGYNFVSVCARGMDDCSEKFPQYLLGVACPHTA